MQDGIRIEHPVDQFGRIRPVIDTDYIGAPIVGFVIRMEDGFYAITDRDQCTKRETLEEAANFVVKVWRTR